MESRSNEQHDLNWVSVLEHHAARTPDARFAVTGERALTYAGALDQSILMLSMVLVGGVGNLRGSIVGAAILVLLPELLRFLSLPEAQAANLRLGIYGLALILMMHLRPQGVAGEYRVT